MLLDLDRSHTFNLLFMPEHHGPVEFLNLIGEKVSMISYNPKALTMPAVIKITV